MILVDTSVWVDHFRKGHPDLIRLLADGDVVMHPMILGELACGQLPKRSKTLQFLADLPHLDVESDVTVLHALESRHWHGTGVGWVDSHLLTSALVARVRLWTTDARLGWLARAAGI
ncbi:MAG: PIN domain-containing protein [Bryobacteraceae bacterium]